MHHQVIICEDIQTELSRYLSEHHYDKLFVLTDTHTHRLCFPVICPLPAIGQATSIVIEDGDTNKNIEQLATVWEMLSRNGASRDSLLINLGGGMITDLGGFAGATFKRGIHTLNIPTTLMASVDAAAGGKTGINFNGLKNEIGAFHIPDCVLIDCVFLHTLDQNNLLSGYAEMIKHGLIHSEAELNKLLSYDPVAKELNMDMLNVLITESVAIKERIVTEDPKEKGIRKALNLGHTIGHAFESLSFTKQRPVLHGHAVAAGLVGELYLSYQCCGFPVEILRRTVNFIKAHYPPFLFDCNDYEMLCELMTHDKKNKDGVINFTLLAHPGDIRINQTPGKERIVESLDFYRETCL
jgi:3-dehydroquinate synthase